MNSLEKFKQDIGISNIALDFRKSSTSNRYWAKVVTPDNRVIPFVTTEEFDQSAPIYVAPTEIKEQITDEDTGEVIERTSVINVLTNKVPAEVSFSL